MKLPALSNNTYTWIGVAIVVVVAVFLIRPIWAMLRGRREGFQSPAETAVPEFKAPSIKMDVPTEAVPQTCAMMYALRENLDKQMESAQRTSNKALVALLNPSIKEIQNEIDRLKCTELSAPSTSG